MILVLTAGFGDGHNTAARCVAEALRRKNPGEEVRVSDLISETHPMISDALKALYQLAITNLPSAWRLTFYLLEKIETGTRKEAWQIPMLNALSTIMERDKPRVVVSTYPLYAGLLAVLKMEMPVPPLVTVITDSISVHPVWMCGPSDAFCVADKETADVLPKIGGDPARAHITGFPVSLAFNDLLESTSSDEKGRVLYLPSTSTSWFARTLEALRPQLAAGLHLTIPVGKHLPRLYQALRAFTDSMPQASVEIIGWTDRMPELLRTHDAVISKAGGAILHEVLAARCPSIIDYVVPGQEEGNAEYLLAHRCAIRSRSPQETADAVARLLENDRALGKEFRENMRPVSIPDAAMRVASVVEKTAGRGISA